MFGPGADPFGMFANDPFFRDPFSHMQRQMDQMMNSMGLPSFGPGLFGAPLHQQQQYLQHQQQPARSASVPRIEEVHDDEADAHATAHHHGRSYSNQPIVEEPDDEEHHPRQSQRPRHSSPHQQHYQPSSNPSTSTAAAASRGMPGANRAGGGNVGVTFSYSSSSFSSSSGPGGVTYQSTSTTRMGPNGVRETQSTVRDGRTGQQSITISRGLGNQERTMTRTRDATGRESRNEQLQGLGQDELDRFDQEWMQQADRNLLGGTSARLGYGGAGAASGSGRAAPLALPHAGGAGGPGGGLHGSAYGQPGAYGSGAGLSGSGRHYGAASRSGSQQW